MKHSEPQTLIVSDSQADRRLDKYIRSQVKGVPATVLFRMMRTKRITVNGAKCKPDQRTVAGDKVHLPALEVAEAKPKPAGDRKAAEQLARRLSRHIVFEDDDLLIVNKPANIAVHVGSGVKAGVIEALRVLRPEDKELELAHRLDKETSGLLIVAKNSKMLRHLQGLLREGGEDIQRYYLAVVGGAVKKSGKQPRRIDAPLRKTGAATVVDRRAGQQAETKLWVKKPWGRAGTLVEAQLLTGRKHQIRVHLQHLGHPIIGDSRYGDKAANHAAAEKGVRMLMLHASRLVIPLPGGEELDVQAPMPPAWNKLRG